MEAPIELRLPFLGQRAYLHGTTLFDVLAPHCADGRDLSFRLARLIESDRVSIERYDPAGDDAGRFAATLTWSRGSERHGLGVTALTPSGAPQREPFDEAAIVARAALEGATARTRSQGSDTTVRHIVALNQALLQRRLAPPPPGQWLFARLDLGRPLERFRELRVAQRASVGFAAVSSSIEADGENIGMVVFSWLKKPG